MTPSLRTLVTGLIDYAGLFPPAKLDMASAAEAYARARAGEHEWMLGRFICPVSRLREFSDASAALMPGTFARSGYREQAAGAGAAGERWRISAIVDQPLIDAINTIDGFNNHHSAEDHGRAKIDMVELKVSAASEIDEILDELPEDLFPFFEFPLTTDCRGFIAALAGNSAAAKIRTGGVVGNAFPTVGEVAVFLHACDGADVPFKATAGLHHPVRSAYKLTYEKDSASCTMHGFLNLFVAAALVRSKHPELAVTEAILAGEDANDFRISDDVIGWREHLVTTLEVARVREAFALSFGSCSFDDPIAELAKYALI